jgi:predicted deacetylase
LARLARRVLVSVHDVAPAWVEEVRWLLRELDAIGARPRSLLVIPCHNGRDDLRRCPELVELLQVEVANGSEIVLHGYTHARAGRWRGDPLTVARAALFAREVAEFVSLEWQEQRARLLAGREILEELGLPTRGFCPPGWLHTAELPDLFRELGFTYLVEMLFLLDVQLRRRLVTPWTRIHGDEPLPRRNYAQLGAHLLAPWRTRARLVSVFLHPQGAPRSPVCQRVLRELAQEFERGGVPLTYEEAIRSS